MSPASDRDVLWMRRAIEAGAQGTRAVRPNPRVGCVVVRDGVEIAAGWHARVGGPHAEAMALAQAGGDARGATVYVTLEPCNHFGRTPPCAAALVAAGVVRVVIGCRDPHPKAGGGVATLEAAGIEVVVGVEAEACARLAEVFLTGQLRQRPFVQLKLASTLDGRVAASDGSSRWITGAAARRLVHAWRAEADAVLVGSGTALADDPALDVRDLAAPAAPLPLRVVLDRRGRLHPGLRLSATAVQPTRVYTAAGVRHPLAASAVDVRHLDADADGLAAVLDDLYRDGIHHLLCEGGAELATALLRDGWVDRLDWMIAPKLLGSGTTALHDLGIRHIAAAQQWSFDPPVCVGEDVWLSARPMRPEEPCLLA